MEIVKDYGEGVMVVKEDSLYVVRRKGFEGHFGGYMFIPDAQQRATEILKNIEKKKTAYYSRTEGE